MAIIFSVVNISYMDICDNSVYGEKDGVKNFTTKVNLALAKVYSSHTAKRTKTLKSPRHIILDPFSNICTLKKRGKNKTLRSEKSRKKNKTRKSTHKDDPYINVIVDSGATRHCCNNLDIMSNVRNTNINIMVGNGNIIHATKMGDIGCIKDVLYLPEMKHFLFSISYFLLSCPECRVEFFSDGFQLKLGRKIIARGILAESNLYVLRILLPNNISLANPSDKSLFVDLEKSNIESIKELKKLQGDLPVKFEYI